MLVAIWNLCHRPACFCLLTLIHATMIRLITSRVVAEVPQPASTSVSGLVGRFAHVKTVSGPVEKTGSVPVGHRAEAVTFLASHDQAAIFD